MKNLFSSVLVIALLAMSLAYVGCQKEGVNSPTAPTTTTTHSSGLHKAAGEAPWWASHTPLKAGMSETVIGEVIVWNDLTTIYFTGVLNPGQTVNDSYLGLDTITISGVTPGHLAYKGYGNLEFEVPIGSAMLEPDHTPTVALQFDNTYIFMYHLSGSFGTALSCEWAKSGSSFVSSCPFTVRSLYTITGAVTDSLCNGTQSTGEVQANSNVTISDGTHSVTVQTDANGNYNSGLLPAGAYTVTSEFTGTSQSVTVGPNATANFYKEERPNGSCSAVTGNLSQLDCIGTTTNKHGLGGQTVSLGSFTATTDGSGNYTFSNVPPGNYSVTWGSVTIGSVEVTGTSGNYNAGSYTNDNRPNSTCAAVTGTLLYKDCDHQSGAPLVGETVALGSFTATTDANGNYAFSNVPEGNYPVIWGSATIGNADVTSSDGSYSAGSYTDDRTPPGGCPTYGCAFSQGYWFGGTFFDSKGNIKKAWPLASVTVHGVTKTQQQAYNDWWKAKGSTYQPYTQAIAIILSGSSVLDPNVWAAVAVINNPSSTSAQMSAAASFISNWITAHHCD